MNPKFEKISYEQWNRDIFNLSKNTCYTKLQQHDVDSLYENIQLPNHSNEMMNGYHFRNAYADIHVKPYYPSWYEPCIIPTGIRAIMGSNIILQIHSDHFLSRNHHLIIADGVQLIPSGFVDYDEGHIIVILRNLSMIRHHIKTNDNIGIGIFTPIIPIEVNEDSEYAPISPTILHAPHILTGRNIYYEDSDNHPVGGENRRRMRFI